MRHQNSSRLERARPAMRGLAAFTGILALVVVAVTVSAVSIAGPRSGTVETTEADALATLRGSAINMEQTPPRMGKEVNTDLRPVRNYPEQPPTIPHKTRGYKINLKVNKCLSCHSRRAVEQSQAPMVSVTHFMDRDGQVLASVTPRRYFCSQCHVPQLDAKPLVANDFVDADTVIQVIRAKGN